MRDSDTPAFKNRNSLRPVATPSICRTPLWGWGAWVSAKSPHISVSPKLNALQVKQGPNQLFSTPTGYLLESPGILFKNRGGWAPGQRLGICTYTYVYVVKEKLFRHLLKSKADFIQQATTIGFCSTGNKLK